MTHNRSRNICHNNRNRSFFCILFSPTMTANPTAHYVPSIKQQADKVSHYIVNIVENSAAKEPNWSWRKVNIGLKIHQVDTNMTGNVTQLNL